MRQVTIHNNFGSPKGASRFPVRVLTLVVLTLTLSISVFGDVKKTRHQAQKALRAGDFARAEELYREVLKIDEQDNEARLGLSEALLKQRRLQDSFDHAARVIAVGGGRNSGLTRAAPAANCQTAIASKSAIQPLRRPALGTKPAPRNLTCRVSGAASAGG